MTQHHGNFSVVVAFNVIEDEDRAVTRRQFCDPSFKRNAIQDCHGSMILGARSQLIGHLVIIDWLLQSQATPTKVHQNVVQCQASQPRLEWRVTPKASHVTQYLDEDFLREILRISNVCRHS